MNPDDDLSTGKCVIWHPGKHTRTNQPRVLVVDDYIDTADAISMVLAISGFESDVAYGGQSAIDMTQRLRPEIVLLDIWMPQLSGLDVATRLRADRNTSEVVLIAHSALGGKPDLERAKAAGFDAFCMKPSDADRLASLLRFFAPDRTTH